MFKISAGIWMLIDEINVVEFFTAKFPFLARCKEGDLLVLNFSNLTCMHYVTTVVHMVNFIIAENM